MSNREYEECEVYEMTVSDIYSATHLLESWYLRAVGKIDSAGIRFVNNQWQVYMSVVELGHEEE